MPVLTWPRGLFVWLRCVRRRYGQFPLLVQFGGLSPAAVIEHNVSAMAEAAAVARSALQRCVIGSTDDLDVSHELVSHYLPWLAPAVKPNALPKLNTRGHIPNALPSPVPSANAPTANATAKPVHSSGEELDPKTAVLLRKWYSIELEVYDFALALHQQQVNTVRSRRSKP